MTNQKNVESVDFSVDRQNLYRQESFTDLKVATIRRLIPVKSDGTVDKTRKTIFIGETNILTPSGPLPIQAVIQAKQLQQAIKNFPQAMQAAVDKLAEEVQKMKEKQNSSIIAPGSSNQDSRIIVPGR